MGAAASMYPLRNSDIESKLLPDGYLVLFNPKTDWAHTVNPSAALVWEFCDGTHTVADIVDELVAVIEPADAQALTDEVTSLVQALTREGILTSGKAAV